MFHSVTRKDPEVFLRPKETVYIPMKYVSYEANHNCSSDSPGLSDLNSAMRSTNAAGLNKTMSTRLHKIHFNALGRTCSAYYGVSYMGAVHVLYVHCVCRGSSASENLYSQVCYK